MKTILDLIQQRRSCRSFLSKAVPDHEQKQILKAALWAPTSKNSRPWEFVLIEDKEIINKLSECKPHGASFLSEAPLAIVILANTQKSDVWVEDCAIAAILMQMSAEELNLGSTWIQVHKRMYDNNISASEYVKRIIKAPDHFEVASILAVGYKAKDRSPYSDEDLLWDRVHKELFREI